MNKTKMQTILFGIVHRYLSWPSELSYLAYLAMILNLMHNYANYFSHTVKLMVFETGI